MKTKEPKISIIVPVLNEESQIGNLLMRLKEYTAVRHIEEILIVDGGSTDNTIRIASEFGVTVLHSQKGRAKQMNLGAQHAAGDILYFLHADTIPSKKFETNILEAVKNGHEAGCFRMKFDSDSLFLKFFAWFTRINYILFRGGDQSLFITKNLFHETNGFNEDYMIYEDSEFIGRLYKKTDFKILPQYVKTSARKYEKVGVSKLQFHFGMIHLKNYMGAGPEKLYHYYKKKIAVS